VIKQRHFSRDLALGRDSEIGAYPLFSTGLSRNYSRFVGDPEVITRASCWELRSAIPNEMTPWLGLQLEGLHYAQTGVIEQD